MFHPNWTVHTFYLVYDRTKRLNYLIYFSVKLDQPSPPQELEQGGHRPLKFKLYYILIINLITL